MALPNGDVPDTEAAATGTVDEEGIWNKFMSKIRFVNLKHS